MNTDDEVEIVEEVAEEPRPKKRRAPSSKAKKDGGAEGEPKPKKPRKKKVRPRQVTPTSLLSRWPGLWSSSGRSMHWNCVMNPCYH